MATTTETTRSTVSWTSGINLVAGIWLIIAPFILGYSGIVAALWNDIVVGILIAILAGGRLAGPFRNPGYSWFNVGLGCWLIIAPFILPYARAIVPAGADAVVVHANVNNAMWNDVIVGIIVAVLGAWSALATRDAYARQRV